MLTDLSVLEETDGLEEKRLERENLSLTVIS